MWGNYNDIMPFNSRYRFYWIVIVGGNCPNYCDNRINKGG
jgi:hypothetical protein